MARIAPREDSDGPLYGRILSRRPEIAERWAALSEVTRFGGGLPAELKEAVRQSTAARVGCEYCASVGADLPRPDARTSLAVAVARQIADDPGDISDATFDVLREEFSEDEIVELMAFICFTCIGGQTFGNVIGVGAASEAERSRYKQLTTQKLAAAHTS